MAELVYTANANANRTHTVTRSTGTSVLGAGAVAAVTLSGSLNQIEARAAVRAVIQVLREDIRKASASADLPTTGSKVV